MDNRDSFRSLSLVELEIMFSGVMAFSGCLSVIPGNGIAKRLHRTVKLKAELSGCTVMKAVFWYDMALKVWKDSGTVASSVVHTN